MGERYWAEERIAKECDLPVKVMKEILKEKKRGRLLRNVIYLLGSSSDGMRAADIGRRVGYYSRERRDKAYRDFERKIIKWLQNIGVVKRCGQNRYTLTEMGEKLYKILRRSAVERK